MLIAKNINKSFENIHILKNINLTMHNSKMNMIIGASGGGKTVLMKTLLGLFEPDSGEVFYNGISFFKLNDKQKKELRANVGMVFQGAALFDSLSVIENVMMPLNFHTSDKYKIKYNKSLLALEKVNLLKAINKKPNELSGGMKKRVAIARAIVLEPTYFFCDEPNSGLDPQTSVTIDNLIKNLTLENKMITIINTHDMNSILTMGDYIHFILNGNLSWSGNCKEIENAENIELKKFIFASKFYNIKDINS